MSPVRELLVNTIDQLPETEQVILLQVAMRFVPDDVATDEDILDIKQADEEFLRGEFFTDDDIDWK